MYKIDTRLTVKLSKEVFKDEDSHPMKFVPDVYIKTLILQITRRSSSAKTSRSAHLTNVSVFRNDSRNVIDNHSKTLKAS